MLREGSRSRNFRERSLRFSEREEMSVGRGDGGCESIYSGLGM